MLCFIKFVVPKKYMDKKGVVGGLSIFPSKFFGLKMPENFVAEPFSLSIKSGIAKKYPSEGYVTFFRRKFFVSHCRKRP